MEGFRNEKGVETRYKEIVTMVLVTRTKSYIDVSDIEGVGMLSSNISVIDPNYFKQRIELYNVKVFFV